MPTQAKAFDAAKYLVTPEDYAELLDDALAPGHAGYVTVALGIVARAYGMSKTAAENGIIEPTFTPR